MAAVISKDDAEKALKGITIPPRPTILTELMKEMKKEMADSRIIARLISADVSLSAATLKTVNSPFFGISREVSSVHQAITLLGMRNVTTLVTGLMIRKAVGGDKVLMEKFWDKAEKLANIAAYIAGRLPRLSKDDAYTYTLFRDCGMPVLIQKFPGYKVTLAVAHNNPHRPITEVENERLATNHAVVGYLLGKAWYLPEFLCDAIHNHHDPAIFAPNDPLRAESRTLIAIGALAEQLFDEVHQEPPGLFWRTAGPTVLYDLGFRQAV